MKNLSILFGFVLVYIAATFVGVDTFSKKAKSSLLVSETTRTHKSTVLDSEKMPTIITKKD